MEESFLLKDWHCQPHKNPCREAGHYKFVEEVLVEGPSQ